MNETSEPIGELKIDKDTKKKLDKNFRRRVKKAKIKMKILHFVKSIMK
jgi:hypothetical protein